MYNGNSVNSNDNSDNNGSGSSVGRWKVKTGKIEETMLLLLSLLYSNIDKIFGVY